MREQAITDVVRGADLLSSTPRQIHLQRAARRCATPTYLHVPVAINAAGEKLSKQTRARALPDDPLPALLAAWRFLDQPLPSHAATSPTFWRHAFASWTPTRLPPVRMLPAPARSSADRLPRGMYDSPLIALIAFCAVNATRARR